VSLGYSPSDSRNLRVAVRAFSAAPGASGKAPQYASIAASASGSHFATHLRSTSRLPSVSMQKRTSALETLLNPVLKPWVQTLTRSEAIDRLIAIGIPAGPLQTAAEVLACPQLAARNMFVNLPTEYGPVKAVGNPIKLNNEPQPCNPPPKLGEHRDEVLTGWLGMDAAAIEGLRRDKVI